MPEVHLDGIEARLDRDARRPLEVGDDVVELLACGATNPASRREAEPGRRRQRRVPLRLCLRDEACMSELGRNLRTLGVDRLGEPRHVGDQLVGEDERVAADATALRDGAVGKGREADASLRERHVEVDQLLADRSAGHHPFEARRLDDAVAQCDRAQLRGLERRGWVRNLGHHRGLSTGSPRGA